MYESFYGLEETPFRLNADEKLCFYHGSYENAFNCTSDALERGDGYVLISGRPGTGKTTLCRDIVSRFESSDVITLNILASQLDADELLRKVALELDFPAEKYDRATLLSSIKIHMDHLYGVGKRIIIFIDEAQNLSVSSLQDLNLLAGLQQGNRPVLQVVLIGHTGFKDAVPDAEYLRQQTGVSCELKSMNAEQTKDYVLHRLCRVGWKSDPGISESIFSLLYEATRGTPRLINHVMNRLLQMAANVHKHQVDENDLLLAIQLLIEENRLSLAGGETFASFKQRYISKEMSDNAALSGLESDTSLAETAIGQQFSPYVERVQADQRARYKQVDTSREFELNEDEEDVDTQHDDLGFEDTDLLEWDERVSQHGDLRSARKSTTAYQERTTPAVELHSKSKKEKTKNEECEHNWGGVWWMSNNRHGDTKGGSNVTDGLPSIEIEECPDMSNSVSQAWLRDGGNSTGMHLLKLSIIVLLFLFSIGLIITLFLRFA
jgi:type II secretory pathway predicted ATPase ExeA